MIPDHFRDRALNSITTPCSRRLWWPCVFFRFYNTPGDPMMLSSLMHFSSFIIPETVQPRIYTAARGIQNVYIYIYTYTTYRNIRTKMDHFFSPLRENHFSKVTRKENARYACRELVPRNVIFGRVSAKKSNWKIVYELFFLKKKTFILMKLFQYLKNINIIYIYLRII